MNERDRADRYLEAFRISLEGTMGENLYQTVNDLLITEIDNGETFDEAMVIVRSKLKAMGPL